MKRLTTIQGVLTVLGLLTGIAAIFLPVFGIDTKYIYIELGAFIIFARLAELDLDSLLDLPLFVPLLLAIPISAGYLRWLITDALAPWAWRTGYVLAGLTGVVVLLWCGWAVFDALDAELLMFVLPVLVSLALGTWLVMRNRRAGVPHALNTLIAMQAVYVVAGVLLLVPFLLSEGDDWLIGAWFAFLTIVVYVVQIVLGSLRKGGTEILGAGDDTK